LPDSAVKDGPSSLGVGNPDHTASITGAIIQDVDENEGGGDGNGDSTPQATPGQASPTPTDPGDPTGGGGN
jgi:hypothetical protein